MRIDMMFSLLTWTLRALLILLVVFLAYYAWEEVTGVDYTTYYGKEIATDVSCTEYKCRVALKSGHNITTTTTVVKSDELCIRPVGEIWTLCTVLEKRGFKFMGAWQWDS